MLFLKKFRILYDCGHSRTETLDLGVRNCPYFECLGIVHACFLGCLPCRIRLTYSDVIYGSCALLVVQRRNGHRYLVTLLETMEIILAYVECEPHVVAVMVMIGEP